MKTAILALILFCVMIFPHELGHFIAAKKCGVKVNEFAFGMGPAIWKKQRGETLHSIRLLPIGGYCAMEGEDGDSEEPRAFGNKKPWQRLIVLAAGPLMNLLCAIIILSAVFAINGYTTTKLAEITPNEPAALAGVQAGDKVISIDGRTIRNWNDVGEAIQASGGREIQMTVSRGGDEYTYSMTPHLITDAAGERYVVGVTCRISHDPLKSVLAGAVYSWDMTRAIFQSLIMLFSGQAGIQDLSGPVGVVQMVGEVAGYSLSYYGQFLALICINVGLVNLLPLPALDGGRIIFVLYSWITGKKVDQKVEGTVHAIGIILLLALMAVITFNDVFKLFH